MTISCNDQEKIAMRDALANAEDSPFTSRNRRCGAKRVLDGRANTTMRREECRGKAGSAAPKSAKGVLRNLAKAKLEFRGYRRSL